MRKAFLAIILILLFSTGSFAATYYIDYGAANDSANGTSTATPWKRSPYMTGWSGSYSHSAGDQFIFKGGVTWPRACFPMTVTGSGSGVGNEDYHGVDAAWYSGGAWSRPVFDLSGTAFSAHAVNIEPSTYVIIDNIEIKNMAYTRSGADLKYSLNMGYGTEVKGLNLYVHDWTCSDCGTDASADGNNGGIRGGKLLHNSLLHASNYGTSTRNVHEISYTTIHTTSNAVVGTSIVHDSFIYNILDSADPDFHENGIECFAGCTVYNTKMTAAHAVSVLAGNCWPKPTCGPVRFFNNVFYSYGPAITFDNNGDTYSGFGGVYVFNNTFYNGSYNAVRWIAAPGNFGPVLFSNNHIISDNWTGLYYNQTTLVDKTETNNLLQTTAEAAASGYALGNLYGPASAGAPTVNTGTDLSAYFNAASLSPIDFLNNLRPGGGTWDIGAYEWDGSEPPPGDNPMTVSAGSDRNTNTASETVTGTASDTDTVASVAWSNLRGGSGSCTGTTSWSCGSITMYNGINTITVTGTDSLGHTGSDVIVLTYYESVSNNTTINVSGPQLVYFKATGAGNFKLTGSVNAVDSGLNSFYIDIDSDPAGDNTNGWHLDLTTGYANQDARWGTWDVPGAYQDPTIWALSGANQILYIREREAGTLIQSVKFVAMSADATAPAVAIATSSPQSITSDALTVTGTATDAVWGTGSVCKFRIGAEPDAGNGTACTGTTSWSCAATGFAEGANTLYIECGDAVPNWSTGHSIVVNYGTPTPLPAVSFRGGTRAGGAFK